MTSRQTVTATTSFLVLFFLASNVGLVCATVTQQLSVEESVNTTLFEDIVLNQNFTIVVLPDTQGYTQDYPWIFDNQTKWIVENKEALNIVFVSQLGDLVNIPYNMTQWNNANKSLSILDGNVPYAISPGNHDQWNGSYATYFSYFGHERFCNKTWYVGEYPVENNTNSYQLFSAGGDYYLIFHLQYNPSDDMLLWASTVIDQHPDKRVIVATHEYIQGPTSPDCRSEIGERIWHSLIKPHSDQIFLVLCGHASTQSTLIDTVNGNVVHQLLSDYQYWNNTKTGYLRLLTFCPKQDKIFVKTYSPYLKEYKTDPVNNFIINYDMIGVPISIFSNFDVSQISFDKSSNKVCFEVSCETVNQGYCNVTILKSEFCDTPWTVTIDEKVVSYVFSENVTHASIYFEYTCSSPAKVVIEEANSESEVFNYVLLLFLLAAVAIIVVACRQKHTSRSSP